MVKEYAEKKEVLVVDDEPQVNAALKEYLTLRGYAVRSALSGEEALKECSRSAPQAMLLDLRLGSMHGSEVARILRKEHPSIRIIILSGFAEEGRVLLEENIVSALLSKSAGFSEVERALADLMPDFRQQTGAIKLVLLLAMVEILGQDARHN